MTQRLGFLRVRARSGAGSLLALALIAAIAAMLVTGIVGAVRAFESAAALEAIDEASGDRDRVVVRFESGAGDSAERLAAIDRALAEMGAAGALRAEDDGEGVFVLRPDPARFSGDSAAVLSATLPDLPREVRGASGETVQVSGGLRTTLRALSEGIETRRGPTSVAIGVVGLLALVVAAAASVEPVRTRLEERALLRARGMSKGRLTRIAVAEALPVLVAGSAVGAAAGMLLTWLWSGTIMPLLTVAAAAAALALVGLLTITISTLRGVDRRSVRGDVLTGISAVLFLTIVTGLAAWQFWQAGTPVIVQGNGQSAIDPLIAVAPALVLALFALIAVVLAGPLAALAAALTSRSRGLMPVLPLRLAARRTGRHALTTGTVAFAAATIALSLAYFGSLSALGDTPEEIRVGADVRVTSVPEDADRSAITGVESVDASMRARTLIVRGADGNFPILGVQSPALGDVMLDADGAIDPAALGALIATPAVGLPVPEEATSLSVSLRMPEGEVHTDPDGEEWQMPVSGVVVVLQLVDESGALTQLEASNLEMEVLEEDADSSFFRSETYPERTRELDLPGPGPWRLVAVDAYQLLYYSYGVTSVDVEVSAGGAVFDFDDFRGVDGTVEATERGVRLDLREPAWNAQKPEVTRAVAGDVPRRFPVVMTQDLAASLNAAVGSQLSLRMASFPFTFDTEVLGVVPVLPGVTDGSGILADLTALAITTAEPLPDNELWLATDDPVLVAEEADAAVGGARVAITDPRAAAKAFETALAFLLAAAGAVLLAIVVLVLRRSRGDGSARELGILAVLGTGRRGAVRVRATEDAFAIALGVLGGVLAGLLTAWLIVPSLARAAYAGMAETYPIALVVPPVLLTAAVLVAAAAFIAIAASVRAPRLLAAVMREAE